MKKILLLIFSSICYLPLSAQQCVLDPPSNLQVTNITSCSATMSWNATSGAIKYFVRYRLLPSGIWSNRISTGTDTLYTFTDLQAGKSYTFSVAALCGDGSKSPVKKKQATTALCSLPSGAAAEVINPTSVNITVTLTCPSDTLYYRYRIPGGNWIMGSVIGTTVITLSNLSAGATYEYQVSACPPAQNNWTAISTFTLRQPNFLLIVLDDARYDSYSCNGGPSWFQSTNIDRIANEGINFKENFVVYSYCSPSRGTIVTGLYPHKNGAVDNTHTIYPTLPNVATILNDAGYYTGLMGKYTINPPQPGYDYWLSALPEYVDAKYNYNGVKKTIPGHNTDVLTDSALAFIARTTQPFYLWLGYHAPHDSAIAQPQYQGIFADETMPIPDNTDPYTENYPSFLDDLFPSLYLPVSEIPDAYEQYYETLAGVDDAIGKILNELDSLQILDNTMVIFMSDNGSLFGEHGLAQKRLAYDPSIRVPLFIRYPAWFNAGTVLENEMSLNIDILPTIVQAAGVTDTFHFDGKSLKKLADHSLERKDMLYECLGTSGPPYIFPFIRAVRSLNYKYIYYGCSADTVEEFFDLVNDPEENKNLASNPSYESLIQHYRDRMAVLQEEFEDTLSEPEVGCFIANPELKEFATEETNPAMQPLYPNPSAGWVQLSNAAAGNEMIYVLNSMGELVASVHAAAGEKEIDLTFLSPGMYFLVHESNQGKMEKVIIE